MSAMVELLRHKAREFYGNSNHEFDEFELAWLKDDDRWQAAERMSRLEMALSWFLTDPRFDVAVGGNPNVVERMMVEARCILHDLPMPEQKYRSGG